MKAGTKETRARTVIARPATTALSVACSCVLNPSAQGELNRIGINLNQATRALNASVMVESGLDVAREAARVALAAPEAAAAPFRAARAAVLRDWFQKAKAQLGVSAPDGMDAAAVNAVLIAGIEALAVAGSYAGVTLSEVQLAAAQQRALCRLPLAQ